MPEINVEIEGLIEVQRKMEQMVAELHGAPMLNAMRDATLLVQRDARKLCPVDTGRLRSSIVPEVRQQTGVVIGVVGSNVTYAAAMEFGTRPHWPPLDALEPWARRHGMSAFLVARAIARRGIKGRRYLRGALEQNAKRIHVLIERAVQMIVGK